MESIHPVRRSDQFAEFNMRIDAESTYTFCDSVVAFGDKGGLSDLGIETLISLPGTGLYQHNGLQFGVFKVQGDGAYPFHETNDINDPELVLLKCDTYFEGDEPMDNCIIDSGCIVFVPPSFLPEGSIPEEIGPVVDFSIFDEEDYEDSSVSLYCNDRGIYILDCFLVRNLRLWKN